MSDLGNPSPVEINARFAEIEAQRNMAQSRAVVLAGQMAEIIAVAKELRAKNAALTEEIAALKGEPVPPADGSTEASLPG